MGWRVKIIFDNGTEDLVDEVFETEEEAEDEFSNYSADFATGKEVLMLSGREYDDSEIEDCEIWEE